MNRLLSQIEFAVAAAIFAVIVLLVFFASIARFFGHPLIWSIDLAEVLFIWLCFFGAARAMRQRAHLGVDYLVRKLGYRYRLAVEYMLVVCTLVFLGVLTVQGYRLAILNWQRTFGDSGMPYGLVTLAVPVGSIMLIVAILYNSVDAWRRRSDGRTLIFAKPDTEIHEEI